MRFAFRRVCRQCGAKLVMVSRFLHPMHKKVYVAGPRATLTALLIAGTYLALALVGLALLARACAH
jgi:hypothetical protein